MQACVLGAIGCVKQHSSTSLLHANTPTRFWDNATKYFSIKKVCLWASTDTRGKLQFHLIWVERKEQEKNDRYNFLLGFINYLSHREKSGWKVSQTYFTTGVRVSLHTNQFLTRLESLGVKNKNTREPIRNSVFVVLSSQVLVYMISNTQLVRMTFEALA